MSTPTVSLRPTTASLALPLLAATLALSACGNKGPLVLPDKPKPADTVAPTTPATPAAPAATTTPAIDETSSPLPPSSPPPAADPVINQTSDDGTGR